MKLSIAILLLILSTSLVSDAARQALLPPRQAALVGVQMKISNPLDVLTPKTSALARPDPFRLVTNYLTLSWTNSPGARGITIWFGKTETFDTARAVFSGPWREIRIDPVSSYTFVLYSGPASNRPPRFFGVIATIGANEKISEFIPWHYPPYPPIPDGVLLRWDTPNPVLIETSTNLVNWKHFAEPVEDFLIVRSENPTMFFQASPIGLVTDPVTTTITQLYRPDPREVTP